MATYPTSGKPIPGFYEHKRRESIAAKKEKQKRDQAALKQSIADAKQKKQEILRTLATLPTNTKNSQTILNTLTFLLALTVIISTFVANLNQDSEIALNTMYLSMIGFVPTGLLAAGWRELMNTDIVRNINSRILYNKAMKLIKPDLSERELKNIYKCCDTKVIEYISSQHPRIFENLLLNGLENANYETVNAIIRGHLTEHPSDYENLIRCFDEMSLPPYIRRDFGSNKNTKSH